MVVVVVVVAGCIGLRTYVFGLLFRLVLLLQLLCVQCWIHHPCNKSKNGNTVTQGYIRLHKVTQDYTVEMAYLMMQYTVLLGDRIV